MRSMNRSGKAAVIAALGMLPLAPAHTEETSPPPDRPTAGATETPCAYMDPAPEETLKLRARYQEAQRLDQPLPVPSPEEVAQFIKWQRAALLQDFGGNCRYASANAALPQDTRHRVVFIGDSITEGWAVQDPAFFDSSRIDRGISGQTTPQMLVRFRQDVLDLHPETVHILAGINDIAGNTGPTSLSRIEDNIMSMVEQAHARHIRVVVGSLLPAAVIPWRRSIGPAEQVRAINAWLKAYARREHLTYVDYYSALSDADGGLPAKYSQDGVHPNHAAYLVMESLATRALTR